MIPSLFRSFIVGWFARNIVYKQIDPFSPCTRVNSLSMKQQLGGCRRYLERDLDEMTNVSAVEKRIVVSINDEEC